MATSTVIGNVVTAVINRISDIKTAIGNATTSAAGLMSAAQAQKLDGIADGANKTTIADNLTTQTAGMALDATQGKALNDSIASANSSMADSGLFDWCARQHWVGNTLSFSDLISRTTVTAFSNWYYDTEGHFPADAGSGLLFPVPEQDVRLILYFTYGGQMFIGTVIGVLSTPTVTWREIQTKS